MKTLKMLLTYGAAACILFLATPSRADLIFQPTKSHQSKVWKKAEASVLAGFARIFDGLAALENYDTTEARKSMGIAQGNFREAVDTYAQLEKIIENPIRVTFDEKVRSRATQVFNTYRMKDQLPNDERDAARLAKSEITQLIATLENTHSVSEPNLDAAPKLLSASIRVQRIGMAVTELLNSGPKLR